LLVTYDFSRMLRHHQIDWDTLTDYVKRSASTTHFVG